MLPSDRSSSAVTVVRDVDPLLKDLSEKKQNFRKSVVSLAEELKEVRTRLAAQEESVARENLTRQEAEAKAKNMKDEIDRLHMCLEERDIQLQDSNSAAEMYVKELDGLRLQLTATKETADESARSARSAQLQCAALVKELEKKNISLEEHSIHVNKLGKQLDLLQKDLHARESSQTQLKDEVARIECEIMQALATNSAASSDQDCELRKILDMASPKNFTKINQLLKVKDDEIARLRDEIRIMSAHWKIKTKELESQLEKHRKNDQELKKKVLKLEFCLHDARAQTRKLQRIGERRERALKELKDELAANATKQQNCGDDNNGNNNFWESSGFKVVVSMSMLILVMFSKR